MFRYPTNTVCTSGEILVNATTESFVMACLRFNANPARLFCFAACLGLMTLTTGCSTADTEKPKAVPAVERPVLVTVEVVREGELQQKLSAVGTVRPIHVSVIASAADGIVDEYPKQKGDYVTANTLLSRLRMKSTDLAFEEEELRLEALKSEVQQVMEPRKEDVEEADAQQQAAAAAFANADRRLKEFKSLAARGAANQSAVEDAEILFDEVRQRMLAAKAVYQRVAAGARPEEKLNARARLDAQEKHVEWLEAEKEKRETKAPFNGFIVEEHSYLGQWLAKGDPVVTMAQLDQVEIEVPVDQSFVAQVSVGDEVKLKVAGTPNPKAEDGRWISTVHKVIPRSDWEAGSRAFPVVLRVSVDKNKETDASDSDNVVVKTPLLEGMMAEAEFFGLRLKGLLVPKDSLVRTQEGWCVFVVNPAQEGSPDSVNRVTVETGISKDGWIQVISDDLKAGLQVVNDGAERLRPFQTIQIQTQDAPSQ